MAESQTRGFGCVLIIALFAFSAVVTAVAILVYGLWPAENQRVDETVGQQLQKAPAAGSDDSEKGARAPRVLRSPSALESPRVLKGHGAIVAVVAVSADGA